MEVFYYLAAAFALIAIPIYLYFDRRFVEKDFAEEMWLGSTSKTDLVNNGQSGHLEHTRQYSDGAVSSKRTDSTSAAEDKSSI